MKTHRLKCWPEFFEAILTGKKRFEARKNDRDFRVGDRLLLMEWDPRSRYTDRSCIVEITGINHDLSVAGIRLPHNVVVMSIKLREGE